MEKESLNFRNNACRINVNVAGCSMQASGFVYKTQPSCKYDYVLTVKHAFQEGEEKPKVEKLSSLEIGYSAGKSNLIELYDKKL